MPINQLPDDVKAVRVTYFLKSKSGITVKREETFPRGGFIPSPTQVRDSLQSKIRLHEVMHWFSPVDYAMVEVEYLR